MSCPASFRKAGLNPLSSTATISQCRTSLVDETDKLTAIIDGNVSLCYRYVELARSRNCLRGATEMKNIVGRITLQMHLEARIKMNSSR
jgi:hypothetical protein